MLAPPMARGRWINVSPAAFARVSRYRVAFWEKLLPTVSRRTVLGLAGATLSSGALPGANSGAKAATDSTRPVRNVVMIPLRFVDAGKDRLAIDPDRVSPSTPTIQWAKSHRLP